MKTTLIWDLENISIKYIDIISIIHHFSMKMYSNRRKILKTTEDELKLIKE